MSVRLNRRLLLGEFVVIVVGVLMTLWVDQLREARANAKLEVDYVRTLVTDTYWRAVIAAALGFESSLPGTP